MVIECMKGIKYKNVVKYGLYRTIQKQFDKLNIQRDGLVYTIKVNFEKKRTLTLYEGDQPSLNTLFFNSHGNPITKRIYNVMYKEYSRLMMNVHNEIVKTIEVMCNFCVDYGIDTLTWIQSNLYSFFKPKSRQFSPYIYIDKFDLGLKPSYYDLLTQQNLIYQYEQLIDDLRHYQQVLRNENLVKLYEASKI